MVQINFAQKTVNAKIVYYGPGMSGKTTNLEVVHQRAPNTNRGELTSISTDGDRTLFFDFMPLDLGTVAGMRTAFQIYTVPGQVYYNSTRKLVLQGVDGVVFVADSSARMLEQNLESLRNLEENLAEYGKSLKSLPLIIQYNKRDLPDAMPVAELDRHLNHHAAPTFEAVASSGQGVFPTLKALASSVLRNIMRESQGAVANGGQPLVTAEKASSEDPVDPPPRPPAAPALEPPPTEPAEPAPSLRLVVPSPSTPELPTDHRIAARAPASPLSQRPGSVLDVKVEQEPTTPLASTMRVDPQPVSSSRPKVVRATPRVRSRPSHARRSQLETVGLLVLAAAMGAALALVLLSVF